VRRPRFMSRKSSEKSILRQRDDDLGSSRSDDLGSVQRWHGVNSQQLSRKSTESAESLLGERDDDLYSADDSSIQSFSDEILAE
jgi:hypothetical protein